MKFLKLLKISKCYLYLPLTCLLLFPASFSTAAQGAADQEAATPNAGPAIEKLSAEEIEALVAPIALYPDDLLAQVLTASTVPLDVVRAARYQEKNKGAVKPSEKEMEAWEPAVVSLMMFPDTLKMMYDNLDWTEQLGAAMYAQEADVYDAVQQLRRQADAAENLITNEKQVIVKEKEIIKIVPANPEIIYVPVYDPAVVYVPSSTVVVSRSDPWITFGVGITVGIGLSYAFNWHSHHVVHHYHWGRPGHHHHYYYKRHPPRYPGRPPGAWRPPPPAHKPGYRPGKPGRPPHAGSKPPGYKPGKPNRPSGGNVKPPNRKPGKATRPATGNKPAARPVQRPATGNKPAARPAQRPATGNKPTAKPIQRPAQKPAVKQRPSTRPSKPADSAVRGYNRGSEARKAGNRGRSSRMGGKAPSRQAPSARPANRGNAGRGQGGRIKK